MHSTRCAAVPDDLTRACCTGTVLQKPSFSATMWHRLNNFPIIIR
ncbi:hypothetical protein [Ruminococcus sp. CAG:330]|nr:hypothetical protein [Ruminococcus sp. CAG:330]